MEEHYRGFPEQNHGESSHKNEGRLYHKEQNMDRRNQTEIYAETQQNRSINNIQNEVKNVRCET